MKLLYKNDEYKLKLYNRNTTIISVSDSDSLFILNELRNNGYDYVDIYSSFETNIVEKELALFGSYDNILKDLGVSSLKTKLIKDLTIEEKALIKILCELLKNKDIIIFFDLLTYLRKDLKDKIVRYIKRENKVFINVTSNEEEFIINEYVVVLNNKMVALEGKCYLIMQQEKLLKRLGFSLPFTIDISIQLNDYGILGNIYSDYELMVGDLWKNKN